MMISLHDGQGTVLTTPKCTLRAWRCGDEVSLTHHANNRKIWLNVKDTFPHPYTLADAEQWIQRASQERLVRNFAIEVEGSAVGAAGIHQKFDVYRRSAEIGYWLGEELWGKGIATEAVKAITDYAFSRFDLLRVSASVFGWNAASMRVLEKAGYAQEARLRNAVLKDARIIDLVIYSLTRPL